MYRQACHGTVRRLQVNFEATGRAAPKCMAGFDSDPVWLMAWGKNVLVMLQAMRRQAWPRQGIPCWLCFLLP